VAVAANTVKAKSHPTAEYTWDVARLFPEQGDWSPEEYFYLEDSRGGGQRIEFDDGRLEFLPMPTRTHQRIMVWLLGLLKAFTEAHAPGEVLSSGMRVQLRIGRKIKFREPDLVYLREEHGQRSHEDYWEGADLVVEIVSGNPKDRQRDLVDKVHEYAAAGIPEYWIIDPDKELVRVLTLKGKSYKVHGEFRRGQEAESVLLPGFRVSVDDILRSGTR
jgi:Uma2 family endonuclease